MQQSLNLAKVAILVADGFEQVEMTCPRKVLFENGAVAHIISPNKDWVKGWNRVDWGETYEVDVPLNMVRAEYYDALILPGGVMNTDVLRSNVKAIEFVYSFFLNHKPVAAICHGAQILIDAEVVAGRKMTSAASIRIDLENAGARWVNKALVNSGGLITSRDVDDLPVFTKEIEREFSAQFQQKFMYQ
jgi:protease I